MHWDIYTGAAVGSGAVLILFAVFGGNTAAKRLLGLVAASRHGLRDLRGRPTSGTYFFPVVMFVIPLFGSRTSARRCWLAHAGRCTADGARGGASGGTGADAGDLARQSGLTGTNGPGAPRTRHRGRGAAGPRGTADGTPRDLGALGPGAPRDLEATGPGTGAQDQSGSAGAGRPALRSPSAPSGAGVNGSRGRVTSVRPGPSRPGSRVRFAPTRRPVARRVALTTPARTTGTARRPTCHQLTIVKWSLPDTDVRPDVVAEICNW